MINEQDIPNEIELIINNKPTGNELRKLIEQAYGKSNKNIFTTDMNKITNMVEHYYNLAKIEEEDFKIRLHLFFVKNINLATQKSDIKRTYYKYRIDGTIDPQKLLKTEEIRNTNRNELTIIESNASESRVHTFEETEKNGRKLYSLREFTKEDVNKLYEKLKDAGMKQSSGKNKIFDIGINDIGDDEFIVVPFEDGKEALSAGAKYLKYNNKTLFYIPKNVDKEKFEKWNLNKMREELRSEYSNLKSRIGSAGGNPESEFLDLINSLGLKLKPGQSLQYTDDASFKTSRANTLVQIGGKHSKTPGSYKLAMDSSGFYRGWINNNAEGNGIVIYNQRAKLEKNEEYVRVKNKVRNIENQIVEITHLLSERTDKKNKENAAKACQEEYNNALPMESQSQSDYAVKKKMDVYPTFKIKGKTLLIPFYKVDSQHTLVNRQKIGWEQDKETKEWKIVKKNAFLADKNGVYSIVSKDKDMALKKMDYFFLCEGISTTVSANMAVPEYPMICTLDSGNMIKVAHDLNRMYPETPIVVLADNDHHKVLKGEKDPSLRQNQKENTGAKVAMEIEKAYGAKYILPELSDEDLEKGLSDWNDIHVEHGLNKVREQIVKGVEKIGYRLTLNADESPKEKQKKSSNCVKI